MLKINDLHRNVLARNQSKVVNMVPGDKVRGIRSEQTYYFVHAAFLIRNVIMEIVRIDRNANENIV